MAPAAIATDGSDNLDVGGSGDGGLSNLPSFNTGIAWDQPWGHLMGRVGVGRSELRGTNAAPLGHSAPATTSSNNVTQWHWAIEGGAMINTWGQDQWRGLINYSHGLSTYMSDMGNGTYDMIINGQTGQVSSINELGLNTSYIHRFNPNWRTTADVRHRLLQQAECGRGLEQLRDGSATTSRHLRLGRCDGRPAGLGREAAYHVGCVPDLQPGPGPGRYRRSSSITTIVRSRLPAPVPPLGGNISASTSTGKPPSLSVCPQPASRKAGGLFFSRSVTSAESAFPRCPLIDAHRRIALIALRRVVCYNRGMTAKIIDGVAIAREIRSDIRRRVEALAAQHASKPGLAVILVGQNAASEVYVRNKVRACAEVGIHSEVMRFDSDVAEDKLLDCIRRLNASPRSTASWCNCRCRRISRCSAC